MLESMSLLAAGMPDLSVLQYTIVDNIFSMTVATMGAAAIVLLLSRSSVDEAYRPALMVSGLVVTIACYHYFMIRHLLAGCLRLSRRRLQGYGCGVQRLLSVRRLDLDRAVAHGRTHRRDATGSR
jgi:energy-converting hydrogenase Eha subunit C